MNMAHWRLSTMVFCLLAALIAPDLQAEISTVWSYEGTADNTTAVQLSVNSAQEVSTDTPLTFNCEVLSKRRFRQAQLLFEVRNEQNVLVSSGKMVVDLTSGTNTCQFKWDSSSVAPGRYIARILANYAPGAQPAQFTWTLLRIEGNDLEQRLEQAAIRMAELEEVVSDTESSDAILRLELIKRAVDTARVAREAEEWGTFTDYVTYLEWSLQSLFNDLLLPGDAELDSKAQNSAVKLYRFGLRLNKATVQGVENVRGLGLNYAVAPIAPANTLSGPGKTKNYVKTLDPFFASAQEHGVGLSMRLSLADTGEWPLELWPEMAERGTDDLSSSHLYELLQWHAASTLPYLTSKDSILSVEVLDAPRFHFDSEQVREAFVKHVEELYPDRFNLNRVWHAHLGSYDEIGIWDDYRGYYENITLASGAEEVRYQERRAYQFDWQRFHMALGNKRLDQVQSFVSERLKKPSYVTLPDTAFASGESRSGLDRMHAANSFGASGITITGRLSDPVFAMEFPLPVAACALARSMAPENPLYIAEARFDFAGEQSNALIYDFVSTMLWESTLSGVTAFAVAEDSPLVNNPRALEAYSVTAQTINRLAPVVKSFQSDLPPIAVLFSSSSRIFDDGLPHLQSCLYAFEGCSFGGYGARFITEEQIANGGLDEVNVLVIPETPALSDAAFEAIEMYMAAGGTIARAATPIPHNENGDARIGVLPASGKTVLVRGMNLPTEYLHAIDAAIVHGALPTVARPINMHGYPLEGVSTRYIEREGQAYLYGVNLRKEAVVCHLTGSAQAGEDLISGSAIAFPYLMEPLQPILVKLDQSATQVHHAKEE